MKLTVTVNLNVRVGKPSVNAPCFQYIAQGSTIEVDGNLYPGDKYEGIDTWYRDDAGNYYWSGGFKDINTQIQNEIPIISPIIFEKYIEENIKDRTLINNVNYNDLLNIDSQIKNSDGINTIIGILDHYINENLPFKNHIIHSNNKTINNPPTSHGCAMAGLIAGNSGIFGVAKSSTILELPIYNLDGHQDDNMIIEALDYFSNHYSRDLIILNISQSLSKVNDTKFRSLASKENLIIVSSAGTDSELLKDELQFPSSLLNVISVGSISTSFYESNLNPNFNENLDIIMPDFDYLTFTKEVGEFDYFGKDSSACAIVSGIIALIVSKIKSTDILVVKKELQCLLVPYSSGSQILNTLNPINPKL